MWKPNVNAQSLFSEVLGCKLRFRATPAALRTIDKYGGLDNYLFQTPDAKLDSKVALDTKRLLELAAAQQQAGLAAAAVGQPWTEEEDEALLKLGAAAMQSSSGRGGKKKHWKVTALRLGTGRSPDAVYLRWLKKMKVAALS